MTYIRELSGEDFEKVYNKIKEYLIENDSFSQDELELALDSKLSDLKGVCL